MTNGIDLSKMKNKPYGKRTSQSHQDKDFQFAVRWNGLERKEEKWQRWNGLDSTSQWHFVDIRSELMCKTNGWTVGSNEMRRRQSSVTSLSPSHQPTSWHFQKKCLSIIKRKILVMISFGNFIWSIRCWGNWQMALNVHSFFFYPFDKEHFLPIEIAPLSRHIEFI